MSELSSAELEQIAAAEELKISSRRPNGSDRPFVVIWAVRVGEDIFVRSAYGVENPWYRHAVASGVGKIASAGIERQVSFEVLDPADPRHQAIHAAYHAKYDHYPVTHVDPVTEKGGTASTLRLVIA